MRILVTVVATLGVLGGLAWWWATLPGVPAAPDRLSFRADPARLRRDVEVLTREVGPRDADHPESQALAAEYLRLQLEAAGVRTREQEFTVRGAVFRNVIGEVGPAEGPYVVVGAHYDAFGMLGPNPGADDNASGAAGLVELGRLLARAQLPVRVELAAFANEEPPYFASSGMGSAVHAATVEQAPPVAMICLEMIGYFSERQEWPSAVFAWLYPTRGDFTMIVGRSADRALAAKVKAGFLARGEMPIHSWTGLYVDGMDASDHRNYWQRGMPAVMVTDTAVLRNPNYHTPNDTADTLDYQKLAQVVEGVANTLFSF